MQLFLLAFFATRVVAQSAFVSCQANCTIDGFGSVGSNRWCQCCGYDCGGSRTACINDNGWCTTRCMTNDPPVCPNQSTTTNATTTTTKMTTTTTKAMTTASTSSRALSTTAVCDDAMAVACGTSDVACLSKAGGDAGAKCVCLNQLDRCMATAHCLQPDTSKYSTISGCSKTWLLPPTASTTTTSTGSTRSTTSGSTSKSTTTTADSMTTTPTTTPTTTTTEPTTEPTTTKPTTTTVTTTTTTTTEPTTSNPLLSTGAPGGSPATVTNPITDKNNDDYSWIVGVVVAVLIVITLSVAITVIWRRRKGVSSGAIDNTQQNDDDAATMPYRSSVEMISARNESQRASTNHYAAFDSRARSPYSSPQAVVIPSQEAHYAEFLDNKGLEAMNRQVEQRTVDGVV